jgi:hypothetical protein
MHVVSALGNIGLRQYGIALCAIPFTPYVPEKATVAGHLLAGNSVLTADWTICLDVDGKGQLTASGLAPRLVLYISFQSDGREQLVRVRSCGSRHGLPWRALS